jgi:hypothetical protein
MNIFKAILEFCRHSDPSYVPKPQRVTLRDVKPNNKINIQWDRVSSVGNPDHIGELKCISNDPITKKILLQVKWSNFKEANHEEFEQVIFSYKDKVFDNFALLNQAVTPQEPKDNKDLKTLLLQKNIALKEQDFELADQVQKQIDEIISK